MVLAPAVALQVPDEMNSKEPTSPAFAGNGRILYSYSYQAPLRVTPARREIFTLRLLLYHSAICVGMMKVNLDTGPQSASEGASARILPVGTCFEFISSDHDRRAAVVTGRIKFEYM
jgi:hypothetical protein